MADVSIYELILWNEARYKTERSQIINPISCNGAAQSIFIRYIYGSMLQNFVSSSIINVEFTGH